jgi:uncharacterized protein (TIRG00374 family)
MGGLGLRSLLTWLGLLVSLVLAYVAVRGVDVDELRTALGGIDYWMLVPAILVLALAVFIRAVRWRVMLIREPRPSTGIVTSALLIGYLFNNILPARAGEAARIVALNQRAGTSRFEALGTVVAERALDVLVLLMLFFACAPVLPEVGWIPNALVLGGVVFALLALVLVAFALRGERPARLLLRPLVVLPRVSRTRTEAAAANLVQGFALFRRLRLALVASALTAVSWLLIALSFWLCLVGFHLELGFEAALLIVVAVNLAMILPSGPAALGVFEAATLVALFAFGVDRSTAFSYAVVVHAVNMVPFIVVGYVAFHYHALAVRRGTGRVEFASAGAPTRAAPSSGQ